jgi:dihydrofolate reductase
MRRLIVTVYSSLDGVIEGEGNAALEKWQLPFADDEFERRAEQQLDACDALLLGRRTYQGFAEVWPTMAGDNGIADRLNGLPKYVASRTLTEPLAWNATLLKGSVPGVVAELKRESGGDILLYGCGNLAYALVRHGLVDEVQVWVHPVVVGPGIRLFHDPAHLTSLQLTGTSPLKSGVVILSYQPASQNDH